MRKHSRVKDESGDDEVPKESPILLSLPFKGDTANTILRHKLGKLTQDTFPGKSLRLVSKTKRLINDRNKDRTSWHERKGVIYEFQCPCGKRYIGMTTRPLIKRMNEHLKTDRASSVYQHLTSTKHQAGYGNFKIRYSADPKIGKIGVQKVFEIVEAKLVNEEQPSLCGQKLLGRKLGFTSKEYHKASKVLGKVSKLTSQRKPERKPDERSHETNPGRP